jgi:hypothetical protein
MYEGEKSRGKHTVWQRFGLVYYLWMNPLLTALVVDFI